MSKLSANPEAKPPVRSLMDFENKFNQISDLNKANAETNQKSGQQSTMKAVTPFYGKNKPADIADNVLKTPEDVTLWKLHDDAWPSFNSKSLIILNYRLPDRKPRIISAK